MEGTTALITGTGRVILDLRRVAFADWSALHLALDATAARDTPGLRSRSSLGCGPGRR
jgi:hypothetical protein